MALLQWLQDELQKALGRQGDSGIVVWYDPGGTLERLVEGAAPAQARLLRFAGSYLALRFTLEDADPDLRGRWLLYIPEPPPRKSWLRDYELLGERLEMDLAELLRRRGLPLTPRLTALLRGRPRNAQDLAEKWGQMLGDRPLTEEAVVQALLALALDLPSWQPEEALLRFMKGDPWQLHLAKRGLWEEWCQEVTHWFGWVHAPAEESALRRQAGAAVLLAEVIAHQPALASQFPFLPSDPGRRERAAGLARRWRQRTDLLDSYCQAAQAVEQEYALARQLTVEDSLLDAETVRCIDDLWLQEVRSAVSPDGSNLAGKAEQVARIAGRRKSLFWAGQDEALRRTWEGLALAARLTQECARAGEESQKHARVEGLVARYAESWWQLDLWALQLAALADHLSADDRRRFAEPAWRAYGDWLDRVNRRLAEAVAREGWHPTQATLWSRVGHRRRRTAVFLVDALRYDLACLLAERTGGEVRWKPEALIAYLPTVTEVGMSALLPDAADRLALAVEREQIQACLEETPVGSRAERIARLQEHLGSEGQVVSLEDVLKTDWQGIQTAVVLSQEVDRSGTFLADLFPAGLLDTVDRIARTIRFLASRGFEQFFVTADHGFLYLPPNVSPESVPAPAAHWRGRRFAAGGSTEGCLVLTAAQQGLLGDLTLAFPKGLAVFALQGSVGAFLHGGLSLQEAVVPLVWGQVVAPAASKVEVSMEAPPALTSRVASIRVWVTGAADLLARERQVIVEVGGTRSRPVTLSLQQPEQTVRLSWLDEFAEPPSEATIRLLDADTDQLLEEKRVPVNLLV